MIFKYCELKARYDNLLASSSQKIYDLNSAAEMKKDSVENQEEKKAIFDKEKELNSKYQQVLEEKDKQIFDLNQQIKDLQAENDGKQEILNLNSEDINYLTERVEKHSKSYLF